MIVPESAPVEVVWTLAVVVAVACAIALARRDGLDRRTVYWCCVIALTGAFAGATILGWYDYGLPDGSWNLLAQGRSFCGGLVGGAMAAWLFLHFRGLSVAKHGDVLVTALCFGYTIGRLGCFLNGCDYGIAGGLPWAVQYPPGTEAYTDHMERGWITPNAPYSLPVHPIQLYAAAAALLMFLVLWRWKAAWPGQRIWLFALFYGTYRFGAEWLRGDFRPLIGPLSLPQLLGLFLVTGALAVSCWRRRQRSLGRISPSNFLTRVA